METRLHDSIHHSLTGGIELEQIEHPNVAFFQVSLGEFSLENRGYISVKETGKGEIKGGLVHHDWAIP